jgi:intein-encoded DNA endonuclease-like protein
VSQEPPSHNQIINHATSLKLLRKEKHVKHLLNLAWDPELFNKKPEELEKIGMELLREFLKFFSEKNVFTTSSSGD